MGLKFVTSFVNILFDLMLFAIIARILMSWMPSGGPSKIKSVLYDITEPVLGIFRKIIPRIGMLDVSPIVAIFALDLAKNMVLYLVGYLAIAV